ncbi:site-specific integrase [Spirosoma jeollabukense]
MAVKLRKKVLANGKLSLYLDLYNGEQRKYEFLKLYLYKRPKDDLEKQHNKAVTQTAENIRAKRELQAGAEQNGVAPALKQKVNFFDYMQSYIDRYTKKDIRMMRYTLKYLREFAATDYLSSKEITENFCRDFRIWMDDHPNLSGETPYDFFAKFKKVIKQAVRDGIFLANPSQDVPNKKPEITVSKDILSVEELQLLAKTDCGNDEVKRAFLIACNTGLRYSDVKSLQWKHYQEGRLRIIQNKTQKPVIINLNLTAQRLLGSPGKPDDFVFILPSHTGISKSLKVWKNRAGLSKTVTFHVARHSFATNLIIFGADVSSASSLLGHTSFEHTQKYVRIVESLKQDAVNRLPEIEL